MTHHLREARHYLRHLESAELDVCAECYGDLDSAPPRCVHRWQLGQPSEGVTPAVCCYCGAKRDFRPQNELTAGRWRNKRNRYGADE